MPAVVQEAEQQLQQSYRERDRLEKQRAKLEHELASWSTKLGVDIPLPASESVDESDASTSSKVSLPTSTSSGGLSTISTCICCCSLVESPSMLATVAHESGAVILPGYITLHVRQAKRGFSVSSLADIWIHIVPLS